MKKILTIFLCFMLAMGSVGCGSDPDPVDIETIDDESIYPIKLYFKNKTGQVVSEIYATSSETGESQLLYDTSMDFMLSGTDIECDYLPASQTDDCFTLQFFMEDGDEFGGQADLEEEVIAASDVVVVVMSFYYDPEVCLFTGWGAVEQYNDLYDHFADYTEDMTTAEEIDLMGTGDFSSYEALGLNASSEAALREQLHYLRLHEYDRPEVYEDDYFAAAIVGYWFAEGDGYEALHYYRIERGGQVYEVRWNGYEDVEEDLGHFTKYDKKTGTYTMDNGFTLIVTDNGIFQATTGQFSGDPGTYEYY